MPPFFELPFHTDRKLQIAVNHCASKKWKFCNDFHGPVGPGLQLLWGLGTALFFRITYGRGW